ncbi:MAG: hypothetical protein ACJARP_002740 [Vicingaceae bacterium]|jgi:hypothetical protein
MSSKVIIILMIGSLFFSVQKKDSKLYQMNDGYLRLEVTLEPKNQEQYLLIRIEKLLKQDSILLFDIDEWFLSKSSNYLICNLVGENNYHNDVELSWLKEDLIEERFKITGEEIFSELNIMFSYFREFDSTLMSVNSENQIFINSGLIDQGRYSNTFIPVSADLQSVK